ncbi:helix-turn-helix transcriptional regulator [Phenylobacterium sp. LjRoot225]|uniref:helix-turn-helix domain-containing protein n=1 Tax=Phenylobacterium sp. LjRoot225 TaxID=3342285 RepID=UPI003ECEC4BD
MPKTLRSPRQQRLIELLVAHRKNAGMSQAALATALGRYQSVIAAMESGSRRIDAIELIDIADAVGFDIHELIDALRATPSAAP